MISSFSHAVTRAIVNFKVAKLMSCLNIWYNGFSKGFVYNFELEGAVLELLKRGSAIAVT